MIAGAKLMLAAVSLFLLAMLAACDNDSIQSLPEAIDPGPVVLKSLAIVPANFTIAPGAQLQFRAFGVFSNGSSQDFTGQVVWSSTNPAFISIDPGTGLATGNSEGLADISALDPVTNISGQTAVTVSNSAIPAIYVALSGSDAPSLGLTPGDPVATINYGIQRAVAEGLDRVRVQAGNYPGIVVVQDGVSLEGGYDANWDFIPLAINKATITGGLDGPTNRYMTVKIDGLVTQTMLSDLHVVGPNASGSVGQVARSSYAVYVFNSSNLVLAALDIDSGNGAPGLSGSSGSNASQIRAPTGQNGFNAATLGCGSSSDGGLGGSGAGSGPERGGNGGNGGRAEAGFLCLSATTWTGAPGYNASVYSPPYGVGGVGGTAGSSCGFPQSGSNGRIQHGSGGAGGPNSSGTVVSGFYDGGSGGAGSLGLTGGGGGGGGGSGGCYYVTTVSKGAGGGGGGAGGQPAPAAGQGGRDGGSSFGVFATNSSLSVLSTHVKMGSGGSGGNGGAGGLGQPGGFGGSGGLYAGGGSPGAPGGQGASGGNSGGGGGGAGGNSYGIFTNASTLTQSANTFSGGNGGLPGSGGSSPYANGSPGQAGALNTIIQQ